MQNNFTQLDITKVSKPDYIKNLGKVDIHALHELVDGIPDKMWSVEDGYKENRFAVFHSTQHIVLRFIENFKDPRKYYSQPAWKMWSNVISPVMHDIALRYDYSMAVFPKVMLAKLMAGQEIDKHIDKGRSNHYVHKIHVPLVTHPDVQFFEKEKSFYLESGYAYEVNNLIPHGVINDSDLDRVHLIFEMFNDTEWSSPTAAISFS